MLRRVERIQMRVVRRIRWLDKLLWHKMGPRNRLIYLRKNRGKTPWL